MRSGTETPSREAEPGRPRPATTGGRGARHGTPRPCGPSSLFAHPSRCTGTRSFAPARSAARQAPSKLLAPEAVAKLASPRSGNVRNSGMHGPAADHAATSSKRKTISVTFAPVAGYVRQGAGERSSLDASLPEAVARSARRMMRRVLEPGAKHRAHAADGLGGTSGAPARTASRRRAGRTASGAGEADRIAAWPERHLFRTQLGPDRNGRRW